MTQLAERLLPNSEIYSSNHFTGKIEWSTYLLLTVENRKIKKKEARNSSFKNAFSNNTQTTEQINLSLTFKLGISLSVHSSYLNQFCVTRWWNENCHFYKKWPQKNPQQSLLKYWNFSNVAEILATFVKKLSPKAFKNRSIWEGWISSGFRLSHFSSVIRI